MIEHVTDLLGAYLDGELHGLRLRQVEEHLTRCAACRQELEQLRGLSALLQESLPVESFTPAERFAANLALRLPRRPEVQPARKLPELAWWLVPAGVVGLWIFTQAVFSVSTWVSAANFTGLLGHAAAGLQAGAPQSLWFSTSLSLFGSRLGGGSRSILDILNELSVFGSDYVVQLVWQAGLGVVLLGWLAAWLSRRRTNGRMHVPASGT